MRTAGTFIAVLLILISSPLSAGLVKPDLRCGSPIPRESVKVLDVAELPAEKVGAFIREQVGGDFEVVKEEQVQANTTFGHAWKKAEKQAAALGCPFVVVLSSWEQVTGFWTNPDGQTTGVPLRKDTAMVMYLMPARQTETAAASPSGGGRK